MPMNTEVLIARKERHLSQTQLATKAGVYRWSIGLIERDNWLPPRPVRQRIARVLGSTEDALFSEAIRRSVAA